MIGVSAGSKTIFWSPGAGYAAAVAVPIVITYGVTWLNLPPFVFEHLIVLLVLGGVGACLLYVGLKIFMRTSYRFVEEL